MLVTQVQAQFELVVCTSPAKFIGIGKLGRVPHFFLQLSAHMLKSVLL
jgi:hypothetical protein